MLSAKHFACCMPAGVYGCTPTCSATPYTRVCMPARVYGCTRCGHATSYTHVCMHARVYGDTRCGRITDTTRTTPAHRVCRRASRRRRHHGRAVDLATVVYTRSGAHAPHVGVGIIATRTDAIMDAVHNTPMTHDAAYAQLTAQYRHHTIDMECVTQEANVSSTPTPRTRC
jgi:hypothetical protein